MQWKLSSEIPPCLHGYMDGLSTVLLCCALQLPGFCWHFGRKLEGKPQTSAELGLLCSSSSWDQPFHTYLAMVHFALFCCVLRQGFTLVDQAFQENTMETKLVFNPQRSTCLSLPSARMKGLYHMHPRQPVWKRGSSVVQFSMYVVAH